MYVADSAVTDKNLYTDTQTDYCNPAAHARRGLKIINVAAHTLTEEKSVKNEHDRMIH